jgi:hypothetical protein
VARAVSATGPSDMTGVCGTGFYISPEIANGWASYDEKVSWAKFVQRVCMPDSFLLVLWECPLVCGMPTSMIGPRAQDISIV